MDLPKSVNIMGIPFDVEVKKKAKDHGLTNGPERKISITENKNSALMESTLLHEIIHGVFYVTGHSEWLTEEQEEALTLALEHAIIPLYKRNF